MSLPLVAIVGRPNVGKSTLFNCLTRSRQALVADHAGLTRDRNYGIAKFGSCAYSLVDTGGIIDNPQGIEALMQQQVSIAIEESALILLLVDASAGLNAADEIIACQLRKVNKPVVLVMNKSDRNQDQIINAEFSRLGYRQTVMISAAHRRGLNTLDQIICEQLKPLLNSNNTDNESRANEENNAIHVAVIGKPNVGKSTLINSFLKTQRMLASDVPGTTRDSISVMFSSNDQHYRLIDTAGIRRRKNVKEVVEKFSIHKTLEAIHECHIALLLIDSDDGINDQDLTLASTIAREGRGLVILFNKWDCLDDLQKRQFLHEWDRRGGFLHYATQLKVSALHGTAKKDIIEAINQAYKASFAKLKTADVNQILLAAIAHKKPQSVSNQAVKLRYAHVGAHNPPTIIIHGNSCKKLAETYKRYLENTFRQAFDLYGTPIRLVFKTKANPYQGIKKRPQSNQRKHKRRLKRSIQH